MRPSPPAQGPQAQGSTTAQWPKRVDTAQRFVAPPRAVWRRQRAQALQPQLEEGLRTQEAMPAGESQFRLHPCGPSQGSVLACHRPRRQKILEGGPLQEDETRENPAQSPEQACHRRLPAKMLRPTQRRHSLCRHACLATAQSPCQACHRLYRSGKHWARHWRQELWLATALFPQACLVGWCLASATSCQGEGRENAQSGRRWHPGLAG